MLNCVSFWDIEYKQDLCSCYQFSGCNGCNRYRIYSSSQEKECVNNHVLSALYYAESAITNLEVNNMLISDESYERVRDAVADIKCCCETEDDYMEWEDIASFSIMAFLEALDENQLKMTVAAFREYAWDIEDEDSNLSQGILTALDRCLR